MQAGHLPNLSKLREQGAYGRTLDPDKTSPETAWTTFLTGVAPEATGYHSVYKYDCQTYRAKYVGTYDFREYPPFYALDEELRVAVFDMPQTRMRERLNGFQLLGWGGHAAQTPSKSVPSELWGEMTRTYGRHPAHEKDHARLWIKSSLALLRRRLLEGIERRGNIAKELLRREKWDLFLTVFGEIHVAGHYFWHLSQPEHPLFGWYKDMFDSDPLLEVFKAVDRAIGDILLEAPSDARVMILSANGMEADKNDLPGKLFTAELMYRYSFPGQYGFTPNGGKGSGPVAPVIWRPKSLGWVRDVWGRRADSNPVRRLLRKTLLIEWSHALEKLLGTPAGPQYPYASHVTYFLPSGWYSPLWPKMPAYALPNEAADGCVRINLRGREAQGVVEPGSYKRICDEISDHFYRLTNPRTGKSVVERVVRTRQDPFADDSRLPDADLLVQWSDNGPFDVVESPSLGRVGPVSYRRSGGHNHSAFVLIKGPGIAAHSDLTGARPLDTTPTLLDLMGARIPDYCQGRSLLRAANWDEGGALSASR